VLFLNLNVQFEDRFLYHSLCLLSVVLAMLLQVPGKMSRKMSRSMLCLVLSPLSAIPKYQQMVHNVVLFSNDLSMNLHIENSNSDSPHFKHWRGAI